MASKKGYVWNGSEWVAIGSDFIDSSKYVTTDTTQTVSGLKTFANTAIAVGNGSTTAEVAAYFNGTTTGSQRISYQRAGSTTWSAGSIGAGSSPAYQVQRYNSGSYVDAPLNISNTSGIMSMGNQPMMYGSPTNTAAESGIANSLGTTMLYNRGFSISGGRITVPVAGVYNICLNHIASASAVRKDSSINVNGSVIAQALSEDSTQGFHYRSINIHKNLAANDYIEFQAASWYSWTTVNDAWRTCSVMFMG